MSLQSLMDSSCTIMRASISKDANQGTVQTFDQTVMSNMPCSFQESSSTVANFYGQRQTVNSENLYFYDDPGAVADDQAIVTIMDPSGNQTQIYLVVEGTATPKWNYRIWSLSCKREESP